MAMKPEPMELEGEETSRPNQGSVFPMQLIQNETLNDRTLHTEQNNPLATAGDINNDIDAIIASTSGSFLQNANLDHQFEETLEMKPVHEKHHSAVSEILLGREQGHPGARGKHYQDSHFPTYTIARGEVELNSKFLPKKYKCALCLYKTSYKSDLNRHMRRHANGRELVSCRDCHASFTSQSTLVFHQMKCPNSHGPTAGNVTVSCEICPYSTSYKSDLTRHMKSHYTHEFACDVCLKPFKVQALVDHHRLTVHNIVVGDVGDVGSEGTYDSMVQLYNPYYQPTAETAGKSDVIFLQDTSNPELAFDDAQVLRQIEYRPEDVPYGDGDAVTEDCVVIDDDEREEAKPNPELLVSEYVVNDRPKKRDFIHSRPVPSVVKGNSQGNILIGQSAKQTGTTGRPETPEVGNKCQLQRQSRVRELLSLNSGKQATVTVPIRQFCCENCHGVYASVKELINHKKSCLGSKTPQRVHRCSLCSFQTCNVLTFQKHRSKHSAVYRCEGCDQTFLKETSLFKHKPFCRRAVANSLVRIKFGQPGSSRNRTKSSDAVLQQKQHNMKTLVPDPMKDPSPGVVQRKQKHVNQSHNVPSNPGDILTHPPDTGRFARLISDFDDFARRPYACALCFYRSTSVHVLSKHVENHLTGCNVDPIPESARFRVQKQNSEVSHPQLLQTHPEHSVDAQREEVNRTAQIDCRPASLDGTQFISNPVPTRIRQQAMTQTGSVRQWRARGRVRVPRFTKAFACRVCSKQFTVRSLMQRHLQKMHKDDMDTGDDQSKE
ncbi:zinc finger protein Xfin-like [Haliotis rufescens]|uniref:zinc finger protein Xfin-like n=1 Tax=Haliotis rufescens TaxID=6454 RepID=UPI001EB02BAF|nr:zinc finger protein Xfin-like [Haliotis rufescens]XP_046378132.1 zinc finger protein Xfin-like [Haliotis rufescens]